MDWELNSFVAGTIQSVLTSVAIVVGGIWAYFRFIRFRTLKPRLDFSFEFKRVDITQAECVGIIGMRITNRGYSKVNLQRDGLPSCHFRYELISVPEASPSRDNAIVNLESAELRNDDFLFTAHRWIEPRETIDDVRILHLPTNDNAAIQVEVVVYGSERWSASTAFPLMGSTETIVYTSDDDQGPYEEEEAIRAEVSSTLSRARRAVLLSSLSQDQAANIIDSIERVAVNIGNRSRVGKRVKERATEIEKASMALRLSNKAKKVEKADLLREVLNKVSAA